MQTRLSLYCERIMEAGWLASVVLIPIFFNIYSTRSFEADKVALLRSIALLMAVAWLIKIAETWLPRLGQSGQAQPVQAQTESFRATLRQILSFPLFWPVLVLALVYILSSIFSLHPNASWWGSYRRVQGSYTILSMMVIFALTATHLRTRPQLNRLLDAMILGGLPVAAYGILQHLGLDPLSWTQNVQVRITSSLGNPIFVASYLTLLLPLVLGRLLGSVTDIMGGESRSTPRIVPSAAYGLVLLIMLPPIVFSQSRGPLLGLLAGLFFFGWLLLLRLAGRGRSLTPADLLLSLVEACLPLVIGVGLGLVIGSANSNTALGLALGVGCGLLAAVTIVAFRVFKKSHQSRLWVNWLFLALSIAGLFVALNLPAFSALVGVRSLPRIGRLTARLGMEDNVGRLLVWQKGLEMMGNPQPQGIPGEFWDHNYLIRPLIGYGPETIYYAFSPVYPSQLVQDSPLNVAFDRSHNESLDFLLTTGILGLLAYYLLMLSLFNCLLKAMGWVPDRAARRRLLALLALGGGLGVLFPLLLGGGPVLSLLGLPAGLLLGTASFLLWQMLVDSTNGLPSGRYLLLAGLFGGLLTHFVSVQFAFSTTVTGLYFWIYAALVAALASGQLADTAVRESTNPRSVPAGRRMPNSPTAGFVADLISRGLIVALVLMATIFGLLSASLGAKAEALIWVLCLLGLVWAVGLALALGRLESGQGVDFGRAALYYALPSLGGAFIFTLAYRWWLRPGRLMSADPQRVISALAGTFPLFLFFVLLGVLLLAAALFWPRRRESAPGASAWWWLYPALILVAGVIITFKNVDMVRADTFRKQADSYLAQQQYAPAISLYQRSLQLDPDEDAYHYGLVSAYLLKGQAGVATPDDWARGERVALDARRMNSHNPDNSAQLGQYYLAWAQSEDQDRASSQQRMQLAAAYMRKAVALAPHNLAFFRGLAEANYYLTDYDAAEQALLTMTALDPQYERAPTQMLLGDVYASAGWVAEAAQAHSVAIRKSPALFADPYLPARVDFYLPTPHLAEIVTAFEESQGRKDPLVYRTLAYIYGRLGRYDKVAGYYRRAQDAGDESLNTVVGLAEAYLVQEKYERSVDYYLQVLQRDPNHLQAHSDLGYAYASLGRLDEAAHEFEQLTRLSPADTINRRNLALLYRDLGRMDDAIHQAQILLENVPAEDLGETYFLLSILYEAAGQSKAAAAALQQAEAHGFERSQ